MGDREPLKEGERVVLVCPEKVGWGEMDDTLVVGIGVKENVTVTEGELDEVARRVVGLDVRVEEGLIEIEKLKTEEIVAILVVGAGVKV